MFDWIKNITKKVESMNSSVDEYKKETNNQPMPVLAYLSRAKKMISTSDFINARQVLNEALNITRKDPLVYKYLGICEEGLNNLENAINLYKISAQINPQDKEIWHKLGLAFIMTKEYKQAEEAFESANKVSPMNTDIQTGWGMSFFKQGKYTQAHEKFVNAIKINRYNFSALLLCAIVEVRLNKYDDAEKKLLFLISANPNEGCLYEYANLCYLKENYELAINYAQKSLLVNSNMLPAYILIGKCYSLKSDYENTIKYFKQAEDKELTNHILYTEWGNALIRLCKFDEADEVYQKALSEDETCIEAKLGMALSLSECGKFNEAETIISNIENLDENNSVLFEIRGLFEYKENNFKKAIEYFKKVLEFNSKEFYNYIRLAKCYEKINQNDMVKDTYEKFLKFSPNFAFAYFDYARYLISINDFKDAQRKLHKAQKLEPENDEILNSLFYVSYVLVKENVSEYNVKEAISITKNIKDFKYPELKVELEGLLEQVR